VNFNSDDLDVAETEYLSPMSWMDRFNVSCVGMLDVVKPLTSLHVIPIRQALYPIRSHFFGGVSGVSLMSNAKVSVERLLSMFRANNLISEIGIGLLNTILKSLLPSISFQFFTVIS